MKRLIATHYEPDKDFTYSTEINENTNGGAVTTRLPCNGDFRSAPCIELLKQSDIVVTNPPFSLFREYIGQLVEYSKKFLIIGSLNAITYSEVFPLIKDNRMWIGASIHSGDREFLIPDDYPIQAAGWRIDENGKKYIRVKGVRWFTNLDYPQRREFLDLRGNHYYGNEDKYPRYVNYDAINVDRTKDIPSDYDGVMGVPISFMDKHCPEQFEVLGIDGGNMGVSYGIGASLTKEECSVLSAEHKGFYRGKLCYRDATGKLQTCYRRILIRKKKQKAQERGEKNLESKARLFIKPDVSSEEQDLERIGKTMTVKELIKYLSQYKDDTSVYLIDYLYDYESYLLWEPYYAPVTEASFQEHGDE